MATNPPGKAVPARGISFDAAAAPPLDAERVHNKAVLELLDCADFLALPATSPIGRNGLSVADGYAKREVARPACVTAGVTIGSTRDETGHNRTNFAAQSRISYRAALRGRSDRANCGRILRILDAIRWAKYRRLGITERGGFKTTAIDHSAIPPRRNVARIRASCEESAPVPVMCDRKCHDRDAAERDRTPGPDHCSSHTLGPSKDLRTPDMGIEHHQHHATFWGGNAAEKIANASSLWPTNAALAMTATSGRFVATASRTMPPVACALPNAASSAAVARDRWMPGDPDDDPSPPGTVLTTRTGEMTTCVSIRKQGRSETDR